ncbi:MAG: hypothetical protein ACR2K0_09555 [Acidimicrobiales bacterium]
MVKVRYGIASGTSFITYDPDGPVRRDQMATFVAGLIDTVGESGPSVPQLPAGASDPFPCDLQGSDSVRLDNIARRDPSRLVMTEAVATHPRA